MSGALAQVTERLYADLRTHATLRQVIAVVRRSLVPRVNTRCRTPSSACPRHYSLSRRRP